MANLKSIVISDVRRVEEILRQRLEGGDVIPAFEGQNDVRIFASLSHLAPAAEESLFEMLMLEDKALQKRARRFRLYPIHMRYLRADVIRDTLGPMAIDEIAYILKGLDSKIQKAVLHGLPEKKAIAVENLLRDLEDVTMVGEAANSRRAFLNMIFDRYIAENRDLADQIFVDENDQQAGQGVA